MRVKTFRRSGDATLLLRYHGHRERLVLCKATAASKDIADPLTMPRTIKSALDYSVDRESPMQATLTLQDGHKLTYTSVGDQHLPILLFVIGSSGLGSLYRRLAAELSNSFHCIYYDKRGFLSATTDHDTVESETNTYIPAGQNANDAAALISHISPHTPAYVFGTSTGATAVFDLAVRYPQLVHTAILHEPITFSVMPSSVFKDEILALYRKLASFDVPAEGSKAFADYMFHPNMHTNHETSSSLSRKDDNREALVKGDPEPRTQPVVSPPNPVQVFNARQGLEEGNAMLAYQVDVERGMSLRDKLVLVRGEESRLWPISQPVLALSRALDGKEVWELAGDHLSFAAKRNVMRFAGQLVDVLRREGRMATVNEATKARL